MLLSPVALGQIVLPTRGTIPPEPVTTSLLLGPDLEQIRGWWAEPVHPLQEQWRSTIVSFAGRSVLGRPPADWPETIRESSTAQAAAFRWAMTQDPADLERAVSALIHMDVVGATQITITEAVTNYACAYDFIRAAPLDPGVRSEIERRLQGLAADIGDWRVWEQENNQLAKRAATRAFIGVLLRNQQLLDSGLSRLNQSYDKTTTDDGWYTDSNGHYLNYTLAHLVPFLRAYQVGSGVSLWEHVAPFINLTIGSRLPTGRTPAFQDGLNSTVSTHLFTRGLDPARARLALWHVLEGSPHDWGNVQNNDYTFVDFFWATDFSIPPTPPQHSPAYFSGGQAHLAALRTGWDRAADMLALAAGVDGKPLIFGIPIGHNHHDSLEIVLAARGELILPAPGYERDDLDNSPPGFDPMDPDEHNCLLVNGSLGSADRTRPENFTAEDRLDAREDGASLGLADLAGLRTSYQGADVRRLIALIDLGYFVVADAARSGSDRTYTFNLVGRGTQSVLDDSPDLLRVRWTGNSARVTHALRATAPLSLTTDRTWMHDTFNRFEETSRARSSLRAANAAMLSALVPAERDEQESVVIEPLPDPAAMRVVHGDTGLVDHLAAADGISVARAGPLESDARFALLRTEDGLPAGLVLAQGSVALINGTPLLDAAAPLTISARIVRNDQRVPAELRATLAADGFSPGVGVTLTGLGRAVAATIDGSPVEYQNDQGSVRLTLPAPGVLLVTFDHAPPCPPDLDDNGEVDGNDFLTFLALFFAGDSRADFNADGVVDGADFLGFLAAFFEGC